MRLRFILKISFDWNDQWDVVTNVIAGLLSREERRGMSNPGLFSWEVFPVGKAGDTLMRFAVGVKLNRFY